MATTEEITIFKLARINYANKLDMVPMQENFADDCLSIQGWLRLEAIKRVAHAGEKSAPFRRPDWTRLDLGT